MNSSEEATAWGRKEWVQQSWPAIRLTLGSSGKLRSDAEHEVDLQGHATSCASVSLRAYFSAAFWASAGNSCGGMGQLTVALQDCTQNSTYRE